VDPALQSALSERLHDGPAQAACHRRFWKPRWRPPSRPASSSTPRWPTRASAARRAALPASRTSRASACLIPPCQTMGDPPGTRAMNEVAGRKRVFRILVSIASLCQARQGMPCVLQSGRLWPAFSCAACSAQRPRRSSYIHRHSTAAGGQEQLPGTAQCFKCHGFLIVASPQAASQAAPLLLGAPGATACRADSRQWAPPAPAARR